MLTTTSIREWREIIDTTLLKQSEQIIEKIASIYPKTRRVWEIVRNDPYMTAQWDMADYIAVTKMGYNAHGDIHAKIDTANALTMLTLLLDAGVQPDIMKATKKPVTQIELSSLGLEKPTGSMEVIELSFLPEKPEGKMIPGDDPKQLAENLIKLLREEAKVI